MARPVVAGATRKQHAPALPTRMQDRSRKSHNTAAVMAMQVHVLT